MFTENPENPVDKHINDFHLHYLRAAAREDSVMGYTIDYCDVIARRNGWFPIDAGTEMTVHMCDKEYVIKRTK